MRMNLSLGRFKNLTRIPCPLLETNDIQKYKLIKEKITTEDFIFFVNANLTIDQDFFRL